VCPIVLPMEISVLRHNAHGDWGNGVGAVHFALWISIAKKMDHLYSSTPDFPLCTAGSRIEVARVDLVANYDLS
jgi:hypothetical protein